MFNVYDFYAFYAFYSLYSFCTFYSFCACEITLITSFTILLILTKWVHQTAKFQTCNCSGEISPNLYFGRLLLLKAYTISAKKVQKSYASWHWRLIQNWKKKTDLLFQRWQEFREFWTKHLQVSKSCTLIGVFYPKYIMFDLKKYGGVIFCNTGEWYKMWIQTDLWFGKWHVDFGKFSPEHLKVSKFGFWWDLFVQSWKFTEDLCVLTLENDIQANLYKELDLKTLKFRRWWRRLCMIYKVKTSGLPLYLSKYISKGNHSYNTWLHEGGPNIYHSRTDVFKYSFFLCDISESNT